MQAMLRLTAAALAAASLATAQNAIVSPYATTNTSGGIHNSIPWGPFSSPTNGEGFTHQIYDDLRGTPRVFIGMAHRHSWNSNYVSKTYDVKITFADAAAPSTGISTTYANNFKTGGVQTVVFDGKVTWPAMPSFPRAPAPFLGVIKFTTPHVYTGRDPLLVETFIRSSAPVSPTHFFERGPGSTHTAGPVGTGCTATGQSSPMNLVGTSNSSAITNNLTFGPASAPAALWIGDTANMWGPFNLPWNMAPLGSPTCDVNINLILQVTAGVTSAAGALPSSFPYVLGPFTSAVRFRTQWIALDGGTLRSSNGLDHGTPYNASGVPWPCARVYSSGFVTTPPPSGSLQSNGLVTQFHY